MTSNANEGMQFPSLLMPITYNIINYKYTFDLKYILTQEAQHHANFTHPARSSENRRNMRILKNISTHCYMLESVAEKEKWGRYTFLGFDPKLEVTCMNGEMKAGNIRFETGGPSGSTGHRSLQGCRFNAFRQSNCL